MEQRLLEAARAIGGIFTTADAASAGVSAERIAAFVRSGDVVRVRRGAFVIREAIRPNTSLVWPENEYLLRARAVLRSRPPGDALSHHAAALMHGIAVWGCSVRDVDLVSDVLRSRRAAKVFTHPHLAAPLTTVDGVQCVSAAVALAQIASRESVTAAVCSIDSALYRGRVGVANVQAAVDALPRRHRLRAAHALTLADPVAESVGESRTRLILWDLGFELLSQQRIFDAAGLIGRVDFVVGERVVVEFDGLVKYAGCDGKDALAAEKLRESRLVDAGYEVVRVIWRDLRQPADLGRRIRLAQQRAARRNN